MSPFLHDFKVFQPKNSLFKRNFLKTGANANLAAKCHVFLGGSSKIYLGWGFFLPKIHPWLRILGSKSTPPVSTPPPRGKTGHNKILTFKSNLTLKVNQSINPQNNRDRKFLTKVFYTSGPNLVILVGQVTSYRFDKLVIDGHTHPQTQTDRQQQYPKAKNGLR